MTKRVDECRIRVYILRYIYIYICVLGETEKNSRKTNKIENLKERGRE